MLANLKNEARIAHRDSVVEICARFDRQLSASEDDLSVEEAVLRAEESWRATDTEMLRAAHLDDLQRYALRAGDRHAFHVLQLARFSPDHLASRDAIERALPLYLPSDPDGVVPTLRACLFSLEAWNDRAARLRAAGVVPWPVRH